MKGAPIRGSKESRKHFHNFVAATAYFPLIYSGHHLVPHACHGHLAPLNLLFDAPHNNTAAATTSLAPP